VLAQIPLGKVTLKDGDNRLGIKCTGKNPASKGFRVGVDCLILK